MSGTELITAERKRQIEVEGWTPEHDDSHDAGDLVAAAICYAQNAGQHIIGAPPREWPWAVKWWKPSPNDPIRDLVKAGALIAAEIDRRLREQAPDGALDFAELVRIELEKARSKFGAQRVAHESLGVIREEYLEFEKEVFAQVQDRGRMLSELIQIAAMCQRAAEDLDLLNQGAQ